MINTCVDELACQFDEEIAKGPNNGAKKCGSRDTEKKLNKKKMISQTRDSSEAKSKELCETFQNIEGKGREGKVVIDGDSLAMLLIKYSANMEAPRAVRSIVGRVEYLIVRAVVYRDIIAFAIFSSTGDGGRELSRTNKWMGHAIPHSGKLAGW